jgi:hypothetical protein
MRELNNTSATAIALFLVISIGYYTDKSRVMVSLLAWGCLLFYGTFLLSKLSKRRQGAKKMIAGKSGANLFDVM